MIDEMIPMSNAYRARHTAPKTRSGRGTAVVAATGLLTTPTLASIPVFTAVGALAMATSAATEIAVTNLAVTLDTPASGSKINTTDTMKLSWSFDVPSGATEGDTPTFTLPNHVQGAPVCGMQVPDADGNIVGTLSGSGQTYRLIYSSYVNTHENVSVHITRTLSPIAAQ